MTFGKIHYLEAGSGAPLILIHGGLSHASEWIPILKPLSKQYHLYVVDRPGHGLASAMVTKGADFRQNATVFIHTFMEGIGVPKASFIGSSMGGYFGICFDLERMAEKIEPCRRVEIYQNSGAFYMG